MASSIIASAAQKIGGSLVDEAKYLYAVSGKMNSLQTELAWMECFLEDADNREHQEKIVCMWVSEIRDIAYEAEDIIERYLHEVSHHRLSGIWNTMKWFSCCASDGLTLHFVGTSVDDLRTRISDLIAKMQMYGIRSIGRLEGSKNSIAMREQRRTYSHTKEDPMGLEEHEKVVVQRLLMDEGARVIGIVGMGGIGKTTLAQKVISNREIEDHFVVRVWVYISKEFERKSIFEEIFIGLGAGDDKDEKLKIKKLGEEDLARKIREVLTEKACLVVVDDIWYNHSWDTLKSAFESPKSSSSKILITTRNEGVVNHADASGYLHRSDILEHEDSWKLLQQKAFPTGNNEDAADVKAMEELGTEMVKHCKGLPLAIVALGGILAARRTVDEWRIVQKNLSSYLMCEMGEEGENNRVSPVLELSYSDLPFYLKPCFLYLGCFPEDYEISAQRLYHLWEAEGLVTTTTHRAEIEGVALDDIAESYLNQLVRRSMVEVGKRLPNGRIRSCRLHDIMRELCLRKCKDVNFLSTIKWGSSDKRSKYDGSSSLGYGKLRRCALYLPEGRIYKSSCPKRLDGAALRSLLVFPLGDIRPHVDELFTQNTAKLFSLLRVLDLKGAPISDFPKATRNCIHLRYLSLKGTSLSHFPSCIFYLKYLETLDLRSGPYMEIYPSDFQKLERLRHLYLPEYAGFKNCRKLKFSYDQLQQMETFKNFDLLGCRTEDLEKMINLRSFTLAAGTPPFETRESLEVFFNSPVFTSGRLMDPLRRIEINAGMINEKPTVLEVIKKWLTGLTISGRIEVAVDVKIFPDNLTRLRLRCCEIEEKRISELGNLPHLEELGLLKNAVKGNKMRFSDRAFTKLTRLYLIEVEELEEWEVGEGAVPNLRSLTIVGCTKLKKIPDGLPSSVHIECIEPCINGIENYNTCPDFRRTRETAGEES